MSEDKIKQLLREGIQAARDNDKATARDRFEQVTDLDENNERAWFYMAQVVETDEEKRVCLNNVLVINPDNEKARQQLDRLDHKRQEQEMEAEVMPGISRRQLTLFAGGGGAVIVVIILLFVIISSFSSSREAAQRQQETAVVQAITDAASTVTIAAVSAEETRVALIGTDTPTPRPNVLPPTFTPSPGPSETPTREARALPDPNLPGDIAAFGGQDILSNGALELYLYQANGLGERQRISDELGREVRFASVGTRVVYTRYFNTTQDFGMEAININGTQPQLIRSTTGVVKARQPDHCRGANLVAFVAVPQDVPTSNQDLDFDADPPVQLYVIDLNQADLPPQTNAEGTPLPNTATRRLTNDSATYSAPAFSPDCSRVAVIKDDRRSAVPGSDVVIIDVNNPSEVRRVTTDYTTYTESTPRWTADGSQLVFAAATSTNPNDNDIVLVNANGTGAPMILVKNEANDIYPVISPDGQYLAFSSNRQGNYNIYIQRRADGELWQLTDEANDVFVGDWWQ